MREFSTFLESIGTSTSGNLLMAGDFNLQVATPDPIGHFTLSLMNSFNLVQYVTAPTHSNGHLLDLFFFQERQSLLWLQRGCRICSAIIVLYSAHYD